jgi:UDP-N-acetylmuramoylalanine--D-glutamate ligase
MTTYSSITIAELENKSIVIFGLGLEGTSTFIYLKKLFPHKPIALADGKPLTELSTELKELISSHPDTQLHLGDDALDSVLDYDVIIKSPGIPPSLDPIQQAIKRGKLLTSATNLFFTHCPGRIIGVTGTKGKSTTAALIHQIILTAGRDSHLVGNMGNPPLPLLSQAGQNTIFVYELSSYQLAGLQQSPHIAVLLNIVPEHLDYHGSFDQYVEAKKNIAYFQSKEDYLVYNSTFPISQQIAAETKARLFPFSLAGRLSQGCFLDHKNILYRNETGNTELVVRTDQVPLLGKFNLHNVLAAVTVGKILGVNREDIAHAIINFRPLEHRLELVGTYRGIIFYNDSLATVPEATIAALEALGSDVQTVLLGGYDRGLDFSELGSCLLRGGIKNLILFPTTGQRIWEAVCTCQQDLPPCLPQPFFVQDMEEAVKLAYRYTEPGKICLLSPASPSFGVFRDYQERGSCFKYYIKHLNR